MFYSKIICGILFLHIIYLIKGESCIRPIGNNYCLLCSNSFYQLDFSVILKFNSSVFPAIYCIKKIDQQNTRKILILKNTCENCVGFDAYYFELARALEEESKIALK